MASGPALAGLWTQACHCMLCMRICHLHCPHWIQLFLASVCLAGEQGIAQPEEGYQHVAFTGCVWDKQPCTLAVGRNTKWHSHQLILIPSGFQRANSAKDNHSMVLAGFTVDWKEIGKEFCSICMLLSSLLLDKVTQIFQFSLDLSWWLFKAQWTRTRWWKKQCYKRSLRSLKAL